VAHLVFSSSPLAFLINMNEKCKSTSPSTIQVKNRQMMISIEEKLDAISILENVNKLLTYGVMLDLLIVVYVQFVILLTELRKVRFQELQCLCRESTTVSSECTVPKTIDVSLLHFYSIRNN
jgi:hypothetical protein